MIKKLIYFFLQGLLYIVPIAATSYIAIKVLEFMDNNIFKLNIPGLGFVLVIFSIIFVGFIGSFIIKSPINSFFKRILKKAPLLETIYSSVKDLMGAFIGKKKGFKQAVFVKIFDNSTIERIGFITNEDLDKLKINEGRVLVYIPHSYNFSGNLYVVEKKYITPIDASSSEVMKLIVSGGVAEFNQSEKKEKN